jgi:hypothetical protein
MFSPVAGTPSIDSSNSGLKVADQLRLSKLLMLVDLRFAAVLTRISRALVHKWLSPLIRFTIATILLVGLFLDLLSS